jgi:hypothetical protein
MILQAFRLGGLWRENNPPSHGIQLKLEPQCHLHAPRVQGVPSWLSLVLSNNRGRFGNCAAPEVPTEFGRCSCGCHCRAAAE